jgi:hypothetical protein
MAEDILQVAVAREHRVVLAFGNRRIAEPLFKAVHVRLDAEQIAKRARRFIEQRASAVRKPVLRQSSRRSASRA